MDKKIKPCRRLPSKPPGPKFQCCTKLYLVSSALGFDFCPPAPNAQPKGNSEIWGCRGDDNALHTSSFVSSHEGRFGLSSAQIPVLSYYLIPNSFFFSIAYSTTYSYYLCFLR